MADCPPGPPCTLTSAGSLIARVQDAGVVGEIGGGKYRVHSGLRQRFGRSALDRYDVGIVDPRLVRRHQKVLLVVREGSADVLNVLVEVRDRVLFDFAFCKTSRFGCAATANKYHNSSQQGGNEGSHLWILMRFRSLALFKNRPAFFFAGESCPAGSEIKEGRQCRP